MTGTGFQIKDLSTGEFITQTVYYPNPETLDTFYVSDEGWLMLPEPLAAGDYELYEVAALMAMCFPISRYRLPLTAARRL